MSRGSRHLPFRYLEPAFFGGLLDDPLLYLRIRPLGRALLFDCGQIAHLAKRVVKPIDTVFITHAHMDHCMGIPTLIRHHHASPRPLHIYGPPGIVDRVHHLIRGFDWNLSEPTWFTINVHEIHQDKMLLYRFPGPEGFRRHFVLSEPRTDKIIWHCRYLTVEAEILDHKLPVLAFRATERPHFAIDPERLASLNLVPGSWIRALKRRIVKGQADAPLQVTLKEEGHVVPVPISDVEQLYEKIRQSVQGASIGYLCDVGWTDGNIGIITKFLGELTLLCVECTFLAEDVAKARASHHLATSDLNALYFLLAPRYLLPMHLSKSYLRRTVDLFTELHGCDVNALIRLPNHVVPPPLTVDQVAACLHVDPRHNHP